MKRQIHRDRKSNRDSQGLEIGGNRELLFNEYRLSVGDYEKVLEMDSGDDCITL